MVHKPRILVAECMQEISSFNPLQSEYSNFHIERGHAMLAQKGINTGLGGALAVFDEVGFEPVLTISARAGSAGLLSRPGWNRLMGEVLEAIELGTVRSHGYAFQVELTYRAVRLGFDVVEIPITFRDREQGYSKMSWRIAAEAMWLVPQLRRWKPR